MDDFTLIVLFLLAVYADFRCGDALFGNFHPVIGIGSLITRLEKLIYPVEENRKKEFFAGFLLTIVVVVISYMVVKAGLFVSSSLGAIIYYPLFFYLTYAAIACGGLACEAENVLKTMQNDGLVGARVALARIVGRQTDTLEEDEIYRAVIETVAENLSDGVIAPLFYFMLGGLPLAWAYKAINTLDSMLGYKDRRYLYFGRSAAYLDDLANYIPARLSAGLILAAAFFQGLDWRSGWRILCRDRCAHASPNSGYPEAAMAGILGLRLGGDNYYHGQLIKKPFIGDALEPVSRLYVSRAIRNLYLSSVIFVVIMVLIWF
ncbi:MAG: adenosylcobinamide-phosphate synthase CbiB [Pseudomonadota bacterium]|nr:adenosylcobinamide-phosphate synthase CbiB [Pseudomonadota bacterium]